jgi:hypothetical protein
MRAQLKAACWLVGAVACGDRGLASPDPVALDPQTLVAHAGEACAAGEAAAAEQGRRDMLAAGMHWERLPLDGAEGARSVRGGWHARLLRAVELTRGAARG